MQEIAKQFEDEFFELYKRYKYKLPNMNLALQVVLKLVTVPMKPGDEPNAFNGPNAICRQGPDGCCTTYKDGWNKCKASKCIMYCEQNIGG